jgi:hypothetical protein
MNWERVAARLDPLLPPVKILHPYPDARFVAKYPKIQSSHMRITVPSATPR